MLPFPALESLFFNAAIPASLRAAGDVQAQINDVITAWKSEDGSVTATAVGTPILRRRAGIQHPVIELDGASGFVIASDVLDGVASGMFVAGARRTGAPSVANMTLAAISATNSTGTRVQWMTRQTLADRGSALVSMARGGTTTDTYSSPDAFGRQGALSKLIWTSTGDAYRIRTSFGGSDILGAVTNGDWMDLFPSFTRDSISIGFLRHSSDVDFFVGDMVYAGWFAESDLNSELLIDSYLESIYPTRSALLIGDSRLNTDSLYTLIEAEIPHLNLNEIADGGDTIDQCLVEWQTRKARAGNMFRADDAIVLIGVNDTINGVTAATAFADLRALLDDIQASGQIKRIHLCNETPFKNSASATAGEVTTQRCYSAAIDGEVRRRNLILTDTFTAFSEPSDPDAFRLSETDDGLHPNATGNARLARLIAYNFARTSVSDTPLYTTPTVEEIALAINDSVLGDVSRITKSDYTPIYREAGHSQHLNFSWSEADASWTGVEFTITRSINNAAASAVTGAITAVGADSFGRYRFQLAYNAADYPSTAGVVDFKITALGVTKALRVVVTPNQADELLDSDPSSYDDNTVGGMINRSIKAGNTYRHKQTAKSDLNKSADVLITEI